MPKVQLPLQLVRPSLIGTPEEQEGVSGLPEDSQTMPWGTVELGSLKVTLPPGATATSIGDHIRISVPVTSGGPDAELTIAGIRASARPNIAASGR